MDDSILPLILDAKTTKEARDTLERSFGVRGSIEVEDEGGSIATDLHQDEKFVNPTMHSFKWMNIWYIHQQSLLMKFW